MTDDERDEILRIHARAPRRPDPTPEEIERYRDDAGGLVDLFRSGITPNVLPWEWPFFWAALTDVEKAEYARRTTRRPSISHARRHNQP